MPYQAGRQGSKRQGEVFVPKDAQQPNPELLQGRLLPPAAHAARCVARLATFLALCMTARGCKRWHAVPVGTLLGMT